MSLRPDDGHSRSRSKSRTRSRSRSYSHARAPSPPSSEPKVTYVTRPVAESKVTYVMRPVTESKDTYATHRAPQYSPAVSMPAMPTEYEQRVSAPGGGNVTNGSYAGHLPYPVIGGIPYPAEPEDDMGNFTDYPPEQRAGLRAAAAKLRDPYDEDLAYGSLPAPAPARQHSGNISSQRSYATAPPSAGYRYASTSSLSKNEISQAHHEPYQYGKPPGTGTYTTNTQPPTTWTPSSDPPIAYNNTRAPMTSLQHIQDPPSPRLSQVPPSPQSSHARVVEVTPGLSKQSGLGVTTRMDRLSVGSSPYEMSGGLPPPSPLLEPYHGTYQSISPMPSPVMHSRDSDLDDLPTLSQLSSSTGSSKNGSSKHRRSKSSTSTIPEAASKHVKTNSSSHHHIKSDKRRVKVYDAEEDARLLNEALSHHRGPDPDPVCNILPHLTHDQMLELRNEYKKIAKVSGRGINIAKHVKMKLGGNFGKAAYVTALGRWESEGYWANFWYQSHGSRRELLIESLMGRSNADIRQIKESFRDKRYSDDLVKCMERELKADKFRIAILTALEGRKQEETDIYPREYVDKDAAILYHCIMSREGGETAMLDIVTRRSDAHLREVLRTYERQYGSNFARAALAKSNNLVVSIVLCWQNGLQVRSANSA